MAWFFLIIHDFPFCTLPSLIVCFDQTNCFLKPPPQISVCKSVQLIAPDIQDLLFSHLCWILSMIWHQKLPPVPALYHCTLSSQFHLLDFFFFSWVSVIDWLREESAGQWPQSSQMVSLSHSLNCDWRVMYTSAYMRIKRPHSIGWASSVLDGLAVTVQSLRLWGADVQEVKSIFCIQKYYQCLPW